LKETDWTAVHTGGNEAYSTFIGKVKSAFNKHFPLAKLSLKRVKDKKLINKGLKTM